MRSHGSYLAAVWLGASGQLADTYSVSRAILETAGHAFLIFTDAPLRNIWFDAIDSEKARDNVRQKFPIGSVRRVLKEHAPVIEAAFFEQYDRTLAFGGHPNVASIANSTMLEGERSDGGGTIRYYYIFGVPSKVAPSLDTVAK